MKRKARAHNKDERPAPRRSARLANKRACTNPPPTVGPKKHASKDQPVPNSTSNAIPNASAPAHNTPSTATDESINIEVEDADAGPAPGLLSEESYLLLRLMSVGRVYPAFDATSRVTIASPMDEQLFPHRRAGKSGMGVPVRGFRGRWEGNDPGGRGRVPAVLRCAARGAMP